VSEIAADDIASGDVTAPSAAETSNAATELSRRRAKTTT
jgi:hypothetical protein